ncbi:methylase involved in ubiquinone/menaquinone biosynthesis [Rubidibacter lacunae KORDI 51-2]|uniref:Methylase involved in ubiquinone/menaquinone biosynthesis n=1 Tax=Rubidibacter lacunae KORDI 51-2 TaxID=582515 RepID=U5DKV9_9CHRO|nr:class I SAM-dependent methyltransferase [Rubidibacter lacunae]ERN40360.1 methylase involved in ubiquinone/menaquinone biosynthesis [Rubidibacter lacunae KORDI 51-2]
MTQAPTSAVDTARNYYNSSDADTFYFTIWGGENIHIGLYATPDEAIAEASQRTVERMSARLQTLNPSAKVLDLGAGYGGSMRHLARTVGCRCVALNLSEVENARDRAMNREQGLDRLIEVVEGDFAHLPFPDASFEVVWSQDAILHSGERDRVIAEIARVLKSGGEFVFTDPMQADDCPQNVLQPILDRIHLDSLGSPGFYRQQARKVGLAELSYESHSEQLTAHYTRVLQELQHRAAEVLAAGISQGYSDRMQKGLQHWIEGGRKGYLAWGIFHFRKP